MMIGPDKEEARAEEFAERSDVDNAATTAHEEQSIEQPIATFQVVEVQGVGDSPIKVQESGDSLTDKLVVPGKQEQDWRRWLRLPRRRSSNQDWREWSRFRLWRKTRPFWGSVLMILAGLLILVGPASLLQLALLPGSMLWAGLFVGALLLAMGVIQLLVPSHALITGAIGIILSLVSLMVALGGFGIGMLLGIIGGALSVAWKPVARPMSSRHIRPGSPLRQRARPGSTQAR